MLFWHLGVTSAIVLVTLGRRRIDYRIVLLGSILPDLLDKPVGRLLFAERFETSRLFGHTLAFDLALVLGIQLFLRGERARRWFVLPIASLLHLALDGMWSHPITLFWPLFGTSFPRMPVENYWLDVLLRPFQHPVEGLKEVAGLALLAYLAVAFGLHRPGPRREFLRTGRLEGNRPSRRAGPEASGDDPDGQRA
jgi:membrane-bound metal-dependent hydrolase YbcI (DUF457 family)